MKKIRNYYSFRKQIYLYGREVTRTLQTKDVVKKEGLFEIIAPPLPYIFLFYTKKMKGSKSLFNKAYSKPKISKKFKSKFILM